MSVVPLTATWPATVPLVRLGLQHDQLGGGGQHVARCAPSSRAASATPRTRSPVASISPARIRLPSAWPASSPSS